MPHLSFLPCPENGETIYSVMCRCAKRTGLPSGYILKCLTGQRYPTQILSHLPGFIDTIANSCPDGHIWQDKMKIVRNHTALK